MREGECAEGCGDEGGRGVGRAGGQEEEGADDDPQAGREDTGSAASARARASAEGRGEGAGLLEAPPDATRTDGAEQGGRA
ncbi:hypothetical protein C5C57_12565 [Rathayibacter sp. AY1C5]|nr:hypothetical protein C5C57_12565 [Rathayibacter sp. AY1C5]